MKTFTQRELAVLQRAAEIIKSKAPSNSEFYEQLIAHNCAPLTAVDCLWDIIVATRTLTSSTDTA